jgi:hypothetical protein
MCNRTLDRGARMFQVQAVNLPAAESDTGMYFGAFSSVDFSMP